MREIKAVVQSHNEEHNNSKSLNTCTYTLLDIRPLSLNLHTLIANPDIYIVNDWYNFHLKTDRAKGKNKNSLYLFSEVKIFHSCCYVCYQSSVSLGV